MIDLHTHTTWSDGRFSPEQIIKAAIVADLTHIAITDHYFTTKLISSCSYVDTDQVKAYVAHIRELAARYADRIRVLAGLEIDFSSRTRIEPLLEDVHKSTRDSTVRLINCPDFVLFEYVDNRQWYGHPLEKLLALRPQIDVPVGLAHNFLAHNFAPIMSAEELVATLERHRIFVELNTGRSGVASCPQTGSHVPFYRFPVAYNDALWAAFQRSRVLFSIGSDIHHSLAGVGDVQDAWDFVRERGLTDRLITNYI